MNVKKYLMVTTQEVWVDIDTNKVLYSKDEKNCLLDTKQEPLPVEVPAIVDNNVMVSIAGKSYRCDNQVYDESEGRYYTCNCNVFTKYSNNVYECHCCGTRLIGE